MRNNPHPSILDVAYHILSQYGEPLLPEEIAGAAPEFGYHLNSRVLKKELDAHLSTYGYRSPFVEVGRDRYGLFPLPDRFTVTRGNVFIPWRGIAGLVLLMLVFMTLLLVVFDHAGFKVQVAVNSLPEISNIEVSPAGIGVQEAASLEELPLDPAWWQANAVNQINWETQEVARRILSNYYNTCGPAVLAMIINFYRAHATNTGEQITTAQVLTAAREQLGYFIPPYNSGLLTFDRLRTIAGLFGLVQAYPGGDHSLITLDELLDGVRQGMPAIAGMRYHYNRGNWLYEPSGGKGIYNHFVIVFEIEEIEGQEHLRILNPHPGKYLYEDGDAAPVTMSLEQFKESWALNDHSDYSEYGHAVFLDGVSGQ